MGLLDCGSAHLGRGTDKRTAGEQGANAGGELARVQDECERLKDERDTLSLIKLNKPSLRVTYEVEDLTHLGVAEILARFTRERVGAEV